MKHFKWIAVALALLAAGGGNRAAAQTLDVTNYYLQNADFEGTYEEIANTGVNSDRAIYKPEGWFVNYVKGNNKNDMTILKSGDKAYKNFDNTISVSGTEFGTQTYRVRFRNANNGNLTLSQIVFLPKGSYTLSASTAGLMQIKIKIFAGSAEQESSKGAGTFGKQSVSFTTDGISPVELGIKFTCNQDKSIGAVDNFQLVFNGSETDFISAITSNEIYANEKSTATAVGATITDPTTVQGATTAMQDMLVNQYTAVTGNYTTIISKVTADGWTKVGDVTENTTGHQHWSGDDSQSYIEQSSTDWNSNSWSISLSQSVTLPAGDYVFKAAGRRSSGADLKLTVQIGEQSIEVDDYPVGDVGYGIDTDGKAKFDRTGDYANGGKGRAFQWRFVPFSLEQETSITISVAGSASSQYQWVSFCDYTVLAKPSTAASTEAYNISLNAAKDLLSNSTDYQNVTGSERSNLETAVQKDISSLTSDEIDAAKESLDQLIETFKAAKDSYDAFVTAKTTADPTLPYASDAAKKGFTDAVNATVESTDNAASVKTKTEAIITALRAYYESNAKAEGKTEAKAVTITNPIGGSVSSNLDGWTTAVMRINHSEPYTTSDNTAHDYYFDANDDFWRSNATTSASMRQDVTLPSSGIYLLSVMSRSCETISSFKLFAGDNSTEMGHNGSSGQVFGKGWNSYYLVFSAPAGTISIGVEGTTPANKQGNWFSCDNFQLYRIGDLDKVTLDETSTDGPTTGNDYVDMTYGRTLYTGWNSLVLPFDLDVSTLGSNTGSSESDNSESNSSTMQAITYDGTEANADGSVTFKFTTCTGTLAASTPCMVYNNGGSDLTQSLTGTCRFTADTDMSPTTKDGNASGYDFTGTYKAYAKGDGSPIQNGDYYVNEAGLKRTKGGNKLNAFRAFFHYKGTATADGSAKVNFVIDGNDVTGIKAVELERAVLGDGAAYNLAGQKVNGSYKGLVVKNGRKVINK